MTIRAHLIDLREKRAAYRRLVAALEAGHVGSAQPDADDARIRALRSKIVELDRVIAEEEASQIAQARHNA